MLVVENGRKIEINKSHNDTAPTHSSDCSAPDECGAHHPLHYIIFLLDYNQYIEQYVSFTRGSGKLR